MYKKELSTLKQCYKLKTLTTPYSLFGSKSKKHSYTITVLFY